MRQPAPDSFERLEVEPPTAADVGDGELLVEFVVGGLCGSDIPKYHHHWDPDDPYLGDPGVPLHELLGRVVASRADGIAEGDRVVGIVRHYRGLTQYLVNPADLMIKVPPAVNDLAAITIQPVATVLSALSTVPELATQRALVVGLGPLGLLFTHVLHQRGFHVTGIDRVDRSDVADVFGIDELVVDDVRHWVPDAASLTPKPSLAVEAVGHHQGVLADAITMLDNGGHLVAFGLPEDAYVFPMRSFFRKHLSMKAGTTRDWPRFLGEAQDYVTAHPELYAVGITHCFPVSEVAEAFRTHATPAAGRLKVVLLAE